MILGILISFLKPTNNLSLTIISFNKQDERLKRLRDETAYSFMNSFHMITYYLIPLNPLSLISSSNYILRPQVIYLL